MNPVKVKAYGLATVSKRAYFTIQGVCFSVLGILFALSLMVPASGDHLRQTAELADSAQAAGWLTAGAWLLDYSPWILGAALVAGGIETLSMLARFRTAERAAARPGGPVGVQSKQNPSHRGAGR